MSAGIHADICVGDRTLTKMYGHEIYRESYIVHILTESDILCAWSQWVSLHCYMSGYCVTCLIGEKVNAV